MSEAGPTPAPNRRWFRFSLGGMLILFALICAVLAWEVNRVHARRKLARYLKQNGAVVITIADNAASAGGHSPVQDEPRWQISRIRRMLGDEPYLAIAIPRSLGNDIAVECQETFPEASLALKSVPPATFP